MVHGWKQEVEARWARYVWNHEYKESSGNAIGTNEPKRANQAK